MKLRLEKQDLSNVSFRFQSPSWQCRTISHEDINALGTLMLEAYQETIDYDGETLEEAIKEVDDTINGKYGRFVQESSFLMEVDREVASACIITWSEMFHSPFLAFSMTHPKYKNQGLATYLLKYSINALLDEGYEDLFVVVTDGNEPAQHLYEKMGFRV